MKILVLSNTPWAEDNSFGNSYSNLFGGIDGLEIANVYCRYGAPDNAIVERYFQITEKSMLANLSNPSVPTGRSFHAMRIDSGLPPASGREIDSGGQPLGLQEQERRWFDVARSTRWQVLYWVRDLIWKVGRWESPELRRFIDDFAPDLIFQPIYYSNYLSDIALFIRGTARAPMVGYVSDDVYSLRQFSLSPLFWIDRLHKRRKIRQVIDGCEYLYVISEVQKREYEKCFGRRCEVLGKCADFDKPPTAVPVLPDEATSALPLQLVYTGNIGSGRWKSLALVARGLRAINASGTRAQFRIYTTTPVSWSMRRALDVPGSSEIIGPVSADEASQLQRAADVLVHVEGLDLRSRMQVHQSFSTKIVDYLACARCVLAIGPRGVASIDYFIENDSALVASSEMEVRRALDSLLADPGLVSAYAEKAWECGRRNHQRGAVQRKLMTELDVLVRDYGRLK